jgi:hypothetical protein
MLQPLTAPWNLERGVLHANGHLIKAIRSICQQPKSPLPDELIVVAGCVKEEDLYPLDDGEEVWLMLPDSKRWARQLSNRPEEFEGIPLHSNMEFATEMYDVYLDWSSRLELKLVKTEYNPSLIGWVAEQEDPK